MTTPEPTTTTPEPTTTTEEPTTTTETSTTTTSTPEPTEPPTTSMMVFLQKDIWGKPKAKRQAFLQEADQRSNAQNVMAVFAPYLMDSPEKAPTGGLQSPPEKPAFVQ